MTVMIDDDDPAYATCRARNGPCRQLVGSVLQIVRRLDVLVRGTLGAKLVHHLLHVVVELLADAPQVDGDQHFVIGQLLRKVIIGLWVA